MVDDKLAEFGVEQSGPPRRKAQASQSQTQSAQSMPSVHAPAPSLPTGREEDYLRARRSLLVWPLQSPTVDALRKFGVDYLMPGGLQEYSG